MSQSRKTTQSNAKHYGIKANLPSSTIERDILTIKTGHITSVDRSHFKKLDQKPELITINNRSTGYKDQQVWAFNKKANS